MHMKLSNFLVFYQLYPMEGKYTQVLLENVGEWHVASDVTIHALHDLNLICVGYETLTGILSSMVIELSLTHSR